MIFFVDASCVEEVWARAIPLESADPINNVAVIFSNV
jgi:hypothetical protein